MKWRIFLAKLLNLRLAMLVDFDGEYNYTGVTTDPAGRMWGRRHGRPVQLDPNGKTYGLKYVREWIPIYPPATADTAHSAQEEEG